MNQTKMKWLESKRKELLNLIQQLDASYKETTNLEYEISKLNNDMAENDKTEIYNAECKKEYTKRKIVILLFLMMTFLICPFITINSPVMLTSIIAFLVGIISASAALITFIDGKDDRVQKKFPYSDIKEDSDKIIQSYLNEKTTKLETVKSKTNNIIESLEFIFKSVNDVILSEEKTNEYNLENSFVDLYDQFSQVVLPSIGDGATEEKETSFQKKLPTSPFEN